MLEGLNDMLLEKDIGRAIKKAREQAGLTQENLAELINISPTFLRHIETGRRLPSVTTLYHLALELNMSVDEIFFQRQISNQFTLINIEKNLSEYSIQELALINLLIESVHKILGSKDSIH